MSRSEIKEREIRETEASIDFAIQRAQELQSQAHALRESRRIWMKSLWHNRAKLKKLKTV